MALAPFFLYAVKPANKQMFILLKSVLLVSVQKIVYYAQNINNPTEKEQKEEYQMLPNMTAADYAASGTQHFSNEDYFKAIADFTKALRLDPDNTDYNFMTGKINTHCFAWFARTWSNSRDVLDSSYKKYCIPAILYFDKTLKWNPLHAEAYYLRGYIYGLNGSCYNLYKSLLDFSEAYDLDKINPDIKADFSYQIEKDLDKNFSVLTQFPDDKRIRLLLQCLDLLEDNSASSLLRKKIKTHLLELIQPQREKMHLFFAGYIFDNPSNLYNVFPKELMHMIACEFSKKTGITAACSFFHQKNSQSQNNELQSEWNNFLPKKIV